jgi:hypothetical protein
MTATCSGSHSLPPSLAAWRAAGACATCATHGGVSIMADDHGNQPAAMLGYPAPSNIEWLPVSACAAACCQSRCLCGRAGCTGACGGRQPCAVMQIPGSGSAGCLSESCRSRRRPTGTEGLATNPPGKVRAPHPTFAPAIPMQVASEGQLRGPLCCG